MIDMGFDEGAAKSALLKCKGDENAAIEALLSGM
jgi:hypothetical protein